MKFRPCIDIHNGKVKQIVGSSLKDENDEAFENYASQSDASYYAKLYESLGLEGGHIIILNHAGSKYYEESLNQATEALCVTPGLLQIGGGITAENAADFIRCGASHVIVTSYVFSDGEINFDNLAKLLKAVGKERLVLDLSCKYRDDAYYIVTDRWQKFTNIKLEEKTLNMLSKYCDEFLIHATDVEGKQNGIERNVATILGDWGGKPMTYAGGVHSLQDIKEIKWFGMDKLDVTVGSALDIFGGKLTLDEVIETVESPLEEFEEEDV
ncbi:MAG: phosphoribosylformimino-5-aminoimidazole carboxamide ribotide isomerase [Butyrivibrio sp.]|nr:phosphoribosylformimino-5-aminoimidazole carboxamide ribotide isomerase [Butyrivibrio sp.]